MKKCVFSLAVVLGLVFSNIAYGNPGKTYQVTGPILEMNDSMIAIQKGKERWEIARDATTKSNATMKVGDKVTVHYTMTATKVEMKADKAAQAEGKTAPSTAASPEKK
ncbi:MAG: hypothetical protein ABR589_07080 [Chthoniobacterales bacterium]